jgi:quercetin dioxygenase-like cupin family protein
MRTSRVAGLLFLATAALAQQQQPVEITSEPRHHLVFENEYVRVFNVTVGPKDTTLVHRHNHDYLFVTLGDSDVVSARPGEKPVALKLKDGEVRFTPGNFAHAAINNSDRPFHNTTIELLKPSTNLKTCTESCNDTSSSCGGICPERTKLISSDQWSVWMITVPPTAQVDNHLHAVPQLIVPVSNLAFGVQAGSTDTPIIRSSGQIDWLSSRPMHPLINNAKSSVRFVALEFNPEQQKQ